MAAIKEKDLSTAMGITASDYLRMVDTSGTSKKINVGLVCALVSKSKFLSGAWTKTSSSATGTQLTDSLSLSKGIWLVSFTVPPYTATNRMQQVYLEGNDYRVANANYLQGFWLVEVLTTKSVAVYAGAGLSCTWDSGYLNRGGIQAVRIAEYYD